MIDDLIARLEAATEGSEELDRAIADAVLVPEKSVRLVGSDIDIPMWRYPDMSIGTELRFTRSLDAALTLVPGTLMLAMKRGWKPGPWLVNLEREDGGAVEWIAGSVSDTAPLALCIAALKARR